MADDHKYLGQTPPGLTPEKFAPGIVSTEGVFELNAVFSSDFKEFYFSRTVNEKFKLFVMRLNDGTWSEPEMLPFSASHPTARDADMMFSPDGKRLYFISDRPLDGYPENQYNFYYVDRDGDGWGEPVALDGNINLQAPGFYPAIVGDGSLYFTTEGKDTIGGTDSYRAQIKPDGSFQDPVNLGPAINRKTGEGDIFVSPDESYLIHNARGREDGMGRGDLYISFKQTDGTWGQDIHMGPEINSDQIDFCPMVTPDGKYFFFSRGGDIFWVDAKLLDTYR
jgi:Tol biopolymer transport system component